jgi:hypothetical protein
MGYTPGQLDAVSRYLGLPQGYAPAGIPPAAPTVVMPTVEVGPALPAPMPVVVPQSGTTAPMPVVNPDADALSRQLGLAPATRMPVVSPSSPIAPQSVGLQLPPGIAPAGTTPVVMAPTPPNAVAAPPAPVAPPAPEAGPPAPAPAQAYQAAPPRPAAPSGPSWTQKRRADEQAYLASIGDERSAMGRANEAGAVVRDEDAQAEARLARQKEEYAANEASFQRDEAAARDAFRAQTQKQIDEVRNATIDPGRLYRDSGALTGVMVGIGGALAGMASALNKSDPDAFTKVIQRHIDRDVDAQVRGLAQKNAGIADRNTMYAQLVADNRDAVLSRAQTTAAMLESARGMAAAENKRLGTPEAQARFEALDAQLAQRQAQEHARIDGAEEQAAARAMQALANARAEAQRRAEARADKMREFGLKLEGLRLEDKKIELEHGDGANKPNGPNQTFVAVGKDEAGNPTGYHVRDAETAKKRTDDLATGRALLKMYDQIINNREAEGKIGRFTSRGEGSPLGTPKWKTDNAVLAKKVILAEKNIDKLGALSGSDMALEDLGDVNADDVLGDTTTDRLRMRRKLIEDNLRLAEQGEAGTRTRKVVTPGGRAAFVPLDGPANAPNNPKAVKRNPLQ